VAGGPPDASPAAIARAARVLATRDPDLARLVVAHGSPPAWHRGGGFRSLVHIVLGQQVSLASARSALDRLERAAGSVSPVGVVGVGEAGLRAAGITRQKARYVVDLADAVLDGRLDLDALGRLSDEAVIEALVGLRGVGRWTADIYLLMGLGRPDVWPAGDLALIVAARTVKGLSPEVSGADVAVLAEAWRPYRSTAARLLWHDYLLRRGRPLDD
jgi:DNA-3-methyladenine glycosylase II